MKPVTLLLCLLLATSLTRALEQDLPLPADINSPAHNKTQPVDKIEAGRSVMDADREAEDDDFQDEDQEELIASPMPAPTPQTIDYTPALAEITNELREIKKSLNELIEFKRPIQAQEPIPSLDAD